MQARRQPASFREAFTLVELVVVILIIVVLIGLLLPVVTGAIRTSKNAAVTAEINTLAQALASFREKYGDYPPSRIMLSENGRYDIDPGIPASPRPPAKMVVSANGTGGTDISYAQLAQRSLAYLRKFWPRAQLSTSGYVWTTTDQFYDFNGNGAFENDTDALDGFYGVILEGDECLAFFLGGIPMNTAATGTDPRWSMSGFGKLPTNPFSNNLNKTGTFMYNGSRTPPIFELKGERLVDPDEDGFPSYADSLGTGRPFAYFAAYGSDAYDPNDVNMAESDGTVSPLLRPFRVSFPVRDSSIATAAAAISAPPNPYTTSAPNGATSTTWQKGQSFQVISAGADGLYGLGGAYRAEERPPMPIVAEPGLNATDMTIRSREGDNISNFASGRLE